MDIGDDTERVVVFVFQRKIWLSIPEILIDFHAGRCVQTFQIACFKGRVLARFTKRSAIQTVGSDAGLWEMAIVIRKDSFGTPLPGSGQPMGVPMVKNIKGIVYLTDSSVVCSDIVDWFPVPVKTNISV